MLKTAEKIDKRIQDLIDSSFAAQVSTFEGEVCIPEPNNCGPQPSNSSQLSLPTIDLMKTLGL
jgi:hypothetical protein